MSKELKEELPFPSGEVHFSSDRLGRGVRAQDVERDSPDDGQVLGGVILSGACVVFVEDDIERPMQLVLDAPMAAHRLEQALGAEHARQEIIARGAAGPSIDGALRYDPADGGELGEAMGLAQRGSGQNGGMTAFLP